MRFQKKSTFRRSTTDTSTQFCYGFISKENFLFIVVYEKSCDIYWLPGRNCKQDFKIILKSRFLSNISQGRWQRCHPRSVFILSSCILYFDTNTTCWLKKWVTFLSSSMIKFFLPGLCIMKFKVWNYFMLPQKNIHFLWNIQCKNKYV